MQNAFDELVWKCFKSFALQKNPMSLNMMRLYINCKYNDFSNEIIQNNNEEEGLIF